MKKNLYAEMLLIVCAVSSIFSIEASPRASKQKSISKKICEGIFLVNSDPNLHVALDETMKAWAKDGRMIPLLHDDPKIRDRTDQKFARSLKKYPADVEWTQRLDDAEWTPVESRLNPGAELAEADVWKTSIEGVDYYFRPLKKENSKARTIMAAYLLGRPLKDEVVPIQRWVKVGENFGALSDPTVKDRRYFYSGRAAYKEALNLIGSEEPQTIGRAHAIAFLLGNPDINERDLHINGFGPRIRLPDFDDAFVLSLVMIEGPHVINREAIFGSTLPTFYDEEFVAMIKDFEDSQISSLAKDFLSLSEIEGVIFRRDIMLRDISRRPRNVLPLK